MSTLSDQIAKLSPEKRAALEKLLQKKLAEQPQVQLPRIDPVARDAAHFPLSSAEQRLWFLDRFSATDAAFNLHAALDLRGPLDGDALAAGLRRLVERHETLRTRYVLIDGEPRRVVDAGSDWHLERIDLRSWDADDREAELQRRVHLHAHQHFVLEKGNLLAAALLVLDAQRHVLLLAMHHIVSDAWSLTLLLDEVWDGYAAVEQGRPALPPLPVQYLDYAVWQQRELATPRLERQVAYWRQHLEGAPDLLELPTDRARPATQTFAGHELQFRLPRDVLLRLKQVGRDANASLFMVTLTAYFALLARWSGQTDVVVGTDVANRNYAETEPLIGFFVNQLALRCRCNADTELAELLQQVRGVCLGAFANQDVPFNHLVDRLQIARDPSRTPVFQAKFMLQNTPDARSGGDSALSAALIERIEDTSQFDLLLALKETADGAYGSLRYRTDLFDQTTAERLVEHYLALLELVVAEPTRTLGRIAWLCPAEQAMLAQINDTRSDQAFVSVPDAFESAANAYADVPALSCGSATLSYAELLARSERLAARLLERGVAPEQPVAVCMARSVDMVVALLAVLRSGACYVPLDPEYGAERTAYVLGNCAARIVLCDGDAVELPASVERIVLSGDWHMRLPAPAPAAVEWPRLQREQLAYIIYTSGSTGRPKGVAVRHAGLSNFLASMRALTGISAADRLLAVTTVAFDIAALELYLPLLCGASIVLATRDEAQDGRRLHALVRERGITVLQATPSTWRALLPSANGAPLPLLALCGGEALAQDLAVQLLGAGMRLLNVYGPTETTIWSSLAEVSAAQVRELANAPLGRPLANTTLHVLDRAGQPVPVGVPGELYIGGDGLARGYCNNPALTAAAFLPDPFGGMPGARLYRTGDVVRWLADGRLAFLGRQDHQVKVRGYRIELGEIESVLDTHPEVANAVVVTRRDTLGSTVLVAYLHTRGDAIDVDAVLQYAAKYLPRYMLPSAVHCIAQLPLTPNGKVDRKALAVMAAERATTPQSAQGTPPCTALEQRIAAIWQAVLGVDSVHLDQDFFRSGGHSLLAVQLLDRIERECRVELPLQEFFRQPTPAGIVACVLAQSQTDGATDAARHDTPIVADPSAAADPFPLTSIQQAYWLGRSGSFELGNIATQNYLEIDIRDFDADRFSAAWNALVRRHGMLRAVFAQDGTQRILPRMPDYAPITYDLRARVDAEEFLLELRLQMKSQVLPAGTGPLFDLRYSRRGDSRWRVHFCIDMLISDVVSNHILFDELDQLYRDADATLPPFSISFRDYVLAEQALLASPRFERARRYWLDRVPGFPGRPDLPLARDPSRLSVQTFSRRRCTLPAPQWQALKRLGQALQVSPTVLVLSVFGEVLGTWSKEPRFALNLTLFNRLPLHADVERLVGDFTSSLLLEIEHNPHRAFADRAVALQSRLWQDLDHKLFNGVDMIRELARARGGIQGAAMPVVFTSILGLETPGQQVADDTPANAEEGYSASQTSQVWLDHQVAEQHGALTLVWDALDAVFPDGMLDEMFSVYARRLRELADDPASWQRPTCLMPDAQRARRAAINAVPAPVSDDCLHTLFERQAAATPAAIAIRTPQRSIDYATLNRWSDALAIELIEAGADRESLVAIVMHKGWEQIVAAMAILKAGSAYMPVDADLPQQRRAQVIQEGGARIALTQADSDFAHSGLHTIAVAAATLDALPERAPNVAVGADDLAYVIFTSGSTGKPKGVVIDHRGAVNTILDINRRFDVHAGDSVLALSSLSFDLSVYDIFGLLAVGGSIVLPQFGRHDNAAHWWDCIVDGGITVWNTVPALMQLLVDHCERLQPAGLGPLRVVMMSGDWIPVNLPDRIRALSAAASIYSLGGATEASIWSIFHPITEATSGLRSVPYGRPLSNQSFHVLDSAMQPRPDGVTGPLYIGGIGLAKGYWSDPVRTAMSFVPSLGGEMLYRTGDLGRYLPDGNIEFLGREDSQVKVQGYRIELGDIEAALQSHPAIAAAAVNAIGAHQDSKTLVAYVVARNTSAGDEGDGRITDPQQRSLFKLEQRGVRRLDPALPRTALVEGRIAILLKGLAATRFDNQALPKYRYPSAASLYPVQIYVTVGAGCGAAWNLAAGFYYYSAHEHALVRLSAAAPFERSNDSAPLLHLVADLDAIEPLYSRDEALRFSLLEAGYLAAVVADDAAALGMSITPQWNAHAIDSALLPARALVLGCIALHAAPTVVAAPCLAQPVANAIVLPPTAAPIGDYDALQRQSFRRYAARACTLEQMSMVLAPLAVPGCDLLLDARRCDGLAAGWYRYLPQSHALQALHTQVDTQQLFNDANAAIADTAAFALFIVGNETSAELAAVGSAGQRLMAHCWRSGIGVCPIGVVQDSALRDLIGHDSGRVLHAFVGGPIEPEQCARWEPDAAPHAELTPEALADYLAARLPAYMVPRVYIGLAALPLSSNGKVDRKALPRPDLQHNEASAYAAAETPTEQLLATLWAQLLKLERVGRHDAFFTLGGNSLVAMQLASRLRIDHGIELGLRQVFEHPTLAELAAAIAPTATARASQPLIDIHALRNDWLRHTPAAEDHALFPLSMAQRYLFAHQQLDAAATAYNIPAALRIDSALDPAALRAALQRVVDRHEALRTRFAYRDGEIWQRIDARQHVDFRVIDLTALAPDAARAETQRTIQNDALRPFDLFAGPLLRAGLLRLDADHNVLMLNVHHIIADYLSMEILVVELNAAYANPEEQKAPLRLQFVDAALWERAFLDSEVAALQRRYWQQHLAGVPRLKFPDPASGPDGWHGFRVDSDLLARLRVRCRELDVTLFMLGFAAVHQLLAAQCAQNDFAIGTPISTRRVAELEPCIGLLLNTLPIRLAIDATATGVELLRETRTQCMQAFEHKDYPYEELLTAQRRQSGGRDEPPYRVRYVYRRIDAQTAADVADRQLEIQRRDAKFDLLFTLNEADDHAFGEFEYRGSALDADTITLLCSQIVPLLTWLADCPQQTLDALHQDLAHQREAFNSARRQQRASKLGDRLKQLRR